MLYSKINKRKSPTFLCMLQSSSVIFLRVVLKHQSLPSIHPFSTCLTTTCHFPLSSHPSFLHTIRSSRAIFLRIIIKLAILDLGFRSVFGHWLYVDVIWKTQVIIHHIPCLCQSLGSWMLVDVVEVVVIYNKDFLMKQDLKT